MGSMGSMGEDGCHSSDKGSFLQPKHHHPMGGMSTRPGMFPSVGMGMGSMSSMGGMMNRFGMRGGMSSMGGMSTMGGMMGPMNPFMARVGYPNNHHVTTQTGNNHHGSVINQLPQGAIAHVKLNDKSKSTIELSNLQGFTSLEELAGRGIIVCPTDDIKPDGYGGHKCDKNIKMCCSLHYDQKEQKLEDKFHDFALKSQPRGGHAHHMH